MTEANNVIPGLVSVIICAYNNWPDVEMTIASALHQSYHPVEVILVDNSSADETPQEVPKRFGDRLCYIRQPNRECAGAYNAGFAVARGEFIQFVDGDDVLAPNKIEKQVEVFRANPELDIVYGDVRKFQTSDGVADWRDVAMPPEHDMLRRFVAPEGKWLNTLGVLFHRRTLERVGTWDETLYIEDLDYWLRAAWAGCRFGNCPLSPMGFVRLRPDQKSKNLAAMARGAEALWEKALGYVTREPYRGLIAAQLARNRFDMAVSRNEMSLSTRQALRKLALARAASPQTVPAPTYAIVWMILVLPGGITLARSRWVLAVRRTFASLFQCRERLAAKRLRSGLEVERTVQ